MCFFSNDRKAIKDDYCPCLGDFFPPITEVLFPLLKMFTSLVLFSEFVKLIDKNEPIL